MVEKKEKEGRPGEVKWVKAEPDAEAGSEDTCLRPLGLCELGGSCDVCWYGPNSPRKKNEN